MTGQKKRSGRCVLRIKSPHSTSEPLSVGRIKSVDVGAGLLANPRQAPEVAFSPSVVGGDVCEERFFRRFLPEQKAAKEHRCRVWGAFNILKKSAFSLHSLQAAYDVKFSQW